ncbi:MAG: sulfatase-like hydrolase/transferase [Lentisphaerae bacterium]|jgi:arylsulfatase A-like enzyme|nr:sulfatase-like hydrolase/transferase [Lentisphaerota bacterium]MBT4822939.1 sulfatase-like hydrolase/transferase [Lentisphaerota bacterium]MBT5609237.1 sulfatase-like hydrolase/transferase [Lentisphaerota bacterium]MBT7059884.1 sulfatase-like hydrolase/transferase [Lentisphaerota bacterium]MBT7847117.1 sulfatase-like hydrolase/transferase [Lentisphaerota bacterium]
MPSSRPNILFVTSDQQHYSTLGSTNPRIHTPALDRLCAEGTRFDRAYCVNPTCTPTRATMITGMYPSQHGAWTLGTKLFEDVPTLGDLLSHRAGYYTALVGKAHLQPTKTRYGLESIESQPVMRDLDFWRDFTGPWYGFEHVETARMHGCESHAGQHYGIWLEEHGLDNWLDFFDDWPPNREKAQRLRANRSWALPEELHYTRWTGERTIAQIEQAAQEDRPFYIWSSFHDPHPPYLVPEPWATMYDPDDMQPGCLTEGEHDANPEHFGKTQEPDHDYWQRVRQGEAIHGGQPHLRDREELKKDMACYYGMVSFMDQEIGRILDSLDRLGITDNTLVVFTTDHGHFLGQHGLTAKAIHHYEDLLRVPFIVRWPGRVPAGDVSAALQNSVDIAPTFLAAAGLDTPGAMTGVDQLPNWTTGEPVRTWSVTENHHGTRHFHMRTYIDERYKITVYRDGDDGELFDLQEDPGEVSNLWDVPAASPLKARMLHDFMQATLQSEPMRMPRIAGA